MLAQKEMYGRMRICARPIRGACEIISVVGDAWSVGFCCCLILKAHVDCAEKCKVCWSEFNTSRGDQIEMKNSFLSLCGAIFGL